MYAQKIFFQLKPGKPFRDVFSRQFFKTKIQNLVEDLNPSILSCCKLMELQK